MGKQLPTMKIKGKNYVMVKDRVTAFREEFPDWSIEADIVSEKEDKITIKAIIRDENGRIRSTGLANEREGSSMINGTSYVENCETSAIGRALGFLGIGITDSIASAEELTNALIQQTELATDSEKAVFRLLCGKHNVEPTAILKEVGWTGGRMTAAHHGAAMRLLKERFGE